MWVLVAVALSAAVAAPFVFGGEEPLEQLNELERAQRAGEKASTRSDEIRQSLEDIAANLKAGSELSSRGDKIEDLTSRQQDSLRELVDVLKAQLEVLDRSSALVGETTESTTSLAELSSEQSAALKKAVGVLRDIEGFAATAGTRSANLARQALYGARLAEDSADSFNR